MFLDPVQAATLLPAPVQAPPFLPAPVHASPVIPASVQAPTPLPALVQTSHSFSAPVQACPPLPAPVQVPPPLPAPVQVPGLLQVKSKKDDEEDKLSDVETEGYCNDKNPPGIITKLRTVKGQSMKDLYDNTDQVILSVFALVSLLEVFCPSFY